MLHVIIKFSKVTCWVHFFCFLDEEKRRQEFYRSRGLTKEQKQGELHKRYRVKFIIILIYYLKHY